VAGLFNIQLLLVLPFHLLTDRPSGREWMFKCLPVGSCFFRFGTEALGHPHHHHCGYYLGNHDHGTEAEERPNQKTAMFSVWPAGPAVWGERRFRSILGTHMQVFKKRTVLSFDKSIKLGDYSAH
jgi:hypothetical protein